MRVRSVRIGCVTGVLYMRRVLLHRWMGLSSACGTAVRPAVAAAAAVAVVAWVYPE